MIFAKGTKVFYKETYGVISFVGQQYVVIETSPAPNRNPPRIIVYPQFYKDIEIEKASSK
jgi:hypothetical protein